MPLPERVKTALKARAIAMHTADMERGTTNIRLASQLVRLGAQKFLDQGDPFSARAADKVLRTPRMQPRPAGVPAGTPGGAGSSTG